jgi:S-DNA-T family DNA segregation ATPase FtsK/SpoIIIE
MPPGRALRAADVVEVQVALLAPDASGAGQAAALQRIARAAAERDARVPRELRPFRVDQLPDRLTFAEAMAFPRRGQGTMWALVGVGGDDLTARGADLAATPTFVVAGPGRSGKSTLLSTMARSLLAGGSRLAIVAPRPSPLRGLEGEAGVVAVFQGPDLAPEELRAALDEMGPAGVVLIDDAELVKDTRAGADLSRIARAAGTPGRGLILAGEADALNGAFVTWIVDAKRNRRGALLSPQGMADGDLVGARLARSLLGGPIEPGRALVQLGEGGLLTLRTPA